MDEKNKYELLRLEVCYLYEEVVRTSGFEDGNSTSDWNDLEWDEF